MNEHVSLSLPTDEPVQRSNSRKVFIKTYGCQMNVYDSGRMSDALASEGYVPTEEMGEADLILLNTCHIREKAADKVYSALGRLRDLKKARADEGRELMIGVAGCVAQAEGEEIIRRAPAVDVVIGPQTYHRLPEALKRARRQAGRRYGICGRGQVRAPAGDGEGEDPRPWRHRLPHRPGGLRQVLYLLRGALYAWVRSFSSCPADRR